MAGRRPDGKKFARSDIKVAMKRRSEVRGRVRVGIEIRTRTRVRMETKMRMKIRIRMRMRKNYWKFVPTEVDVVRVQYRDQ